MELQPFEEQKLDSLIPDGQEEGQEGEEKELVMDDAITDPAEAMRLTMNSLGLTGGLLLKNKDRQKIPVSKTRKLQIEESRKKREAAESEGSSKAKKK